MRDLSSAEPIQQTNRSSQVYFIDEQILNNAKSAQAGHPVYDDVPHIVCIHPGTPPEQVEVEAKQKHIDRYPVEWAAYKNNKEVIVNGTRLDMWPPLTKAQVATLKAAGISSVEQLAQVDDTQINKIGMGSRKLVQMAKDWLAASEDSKVITQFHATREKLENEISSLKHQLEALTMQLESSKTKKGKET